MLKGKRISRELLTKHTGIYNPLYPNTKIFYFNEFVVLYISLN